MMGVQIGTVTLDEILSFTDDRTTTIPVKRVVRKTTPTTQSQYFTREPKTITITLRGTAAKKQEISNLQLQFAWQALYDYDDSFIDYVWIKGMPTEWRGDQDTDYPWLITLNLICSST